MMHIHPSQSSDAERPHFVLRLYIVGMAPNGRRAVENIKHICEAYLKSRYELEIVDLYQEPELALEDQIIATPTLVRKFPLPMKKLIGDLSDVSLVLKLLGSDTSF